MPVVTRFAPSPTGSLLHIGGAGQPYLTTYMQRKIMRSFKLRIEDTDKSRNTQNSAESILNGLNWLD